MLEADVSPAMAASQVLSAEEEPPGRDGGHPRQQGPPLRRRSRADAVERRRVGATEAGLRPDLTGLCHRQARESDAQGARDVPRGRRRQEDKAHQVLQKGLRRVQGLSGAVFRDQRNESLCVLANDPLYFNSLDVLVRKNNKHAYNDLFELRFCR
jgi:hypothetical protein